MYYYGGKRPQSRLNKSRSRSSSRQQHPSGKAVGHPRGVFTPSPSFGRQEEDPRSGTERDQADLPTKEGGILEAVKEFALNVTTAHAIPNVFKASTVLGRFLWSVIFTVALGVFIWQASVLVRRYALFPVNVEIEIVTRSELEFPAVTICNTNKVRRSAIMESRYKEALVVDDGVTLPYYGPCIEGDFSCASYGLCLKQFLRCDGINHCGDFSDEIDCTYAECSSNEFSCSNGSSVGPCISSSLICDRKRDCYDGDDETGCPCKSNEFQCIRGGCVRKILVCDNNTDCVDNSDEENCVYDSECTGLFRCSVDSSCIPLGYVCDRSNDCSDGEDETVEACASVTTPPPATSPCPQNQFYCSDGSCIEEAWVCDDQVDCADGADEIPPNCERGSEIYGLARCSVVEWSCGNQWQCIDQVDRCNLSPDCYSEAQVADDEYNCTCLLQSAVPSSSQKVTCVGMTVSDASVGFPTVDTTKFQGMSCYSRLLGNVQPNPVHGWREYVCRGQVVCANAANDFPEPCEVFHECYIAMNAQDYRGRIGRTSSSVECQDWSSNVSVSVGFSRDVYPELLGPVCRNPGGSRSRAWCFTAGADTTDDWEFCDIGPPSSTCHPGVELPVRLAGLASPSEGRVEVQHKGEWGTVSDTDWTQEDADVVCRQLGFTEASGRGTLAASTGSVFISQVKCTGYESYLVDCQYHVVMPSEGLSHDTDVSVTCSGARQKRQADEKDVIPTSVAGNCSKTEYPCSSGECIPLWQTCNNFPDCEDGSDEYSFLGCEDPVNKCSVFTKACRESSKCIPRTFECDNYADCTDGSDEEYCNDPNESCPPGYFQCSNGKCIHTFRVCDTVLDCNQGEDEGGDCYYASSDNGRLNPFEMEDWKDPFLPFIPENYQEEFLSSFREYFYTPRPFSRVRSEDPPDWSRFVTFSEQPDYSDLSEVLKLTEGEIAQHGHQFEDLVLQCSFDSTPCHRGHTIFHQIQNEKYGNCYIFNYKGSPESTVRNSSRTGEQSGLALTLFIEQDEYLSLYGREAGVRVTITQPNVAPLPEDEGINLSPGAVTSIGLVHRVISRKPHPFGRCQVNKTTVSEIVDGKIVQVETDNYNRRHCRRVCVLKNILQICGCSDSMELDGERCKLLNATQDLCKQMVYYLHAYDLLNCSCGFQCIDRLYSATVSQASWPSDAFRQHLLRNIYNINPKTKKIRSAEEIRKNLVRLKIFYEELNYQETREVEGYSGTSLFGDIGGIAGLYIGCSIITFIELFEFIAYLIRRRCCGSARA
ncbi:uncharacterized protein LOC110982619 isoform X2 [Acanthaster planci]|nr:uncharacterized protein LOC110982619 isoform X2 [Acanthaster planci]